MPSYSATSSLRLAECHRDLRMVFGKVIKYMDCSILCGHRKEPEQNQAFAAGLSQLQWPDSKHNQLPSMAVDAGPYFIELGNTDWNDEKAFSAFAGRVLQIADEMLEKGEITHKLRWGGDWDGDGRTKDERFKDLPHFELIKATR